MMEMVNFVRNMSLLGFVLMTVGPSARLTHESVCSRIVSTLTYTRPLILSDLADISRFGLLSRIFPKLDSISVTNPQEESEDNAQKKSTSEEPTCLWQFYQAQEKHTEHNN